MPETLDLEPKRPPALPRALCVGAVALLGLIPGCGSGDGDGEIPPASSETLLANLEEIRSACETGDSEAATAAADEFRSAVTELPSELSSDLRVALNNGAERLSTLAGEPEECGTGVTGETDVLPEPTPAPAPPTTPEPEPEPPPEEPPPNEGSGPGGGGNGGGGGDDTGGTDGKR